MHTHTHTYTCVVHHVCMCACAYIWIVQAILTITSVADFGLYFMFLSQNASGLDNHHHHRQCWRCCRRHRRRRRHYDDLFKFYPLCKRTVHSTHTRAHISLHSFAHTGHNHMLEMTHAARFKCLSNTVCTCDANVYRNANVKSVSFLHTLHTLPRVHAQTMLYLIFTQTFHIHHSVYCVWRAHFEKKVRCRLCWRAHTYTHSRTHHTAIEAQVTKVLKWDIRWLLRFA